jgi:hypothetical protein
VRAGLVSAPREAAPALPLPVEASVAADALQPEEPADADRAGSVSLPDEQVPAGSVALQADGCSAAALPASPLAEPDDWLEDDSPQAGCSVAPGGYLAAALLPVDHSWPVERDDSPPADCSVVPDDCSAAEASAD